MRTSLAVLTALSLAACGGSSKIPAAPAPEPETSPTAATKPSPAAAPASGTLTGLSNGDRACYIELDVDGAVQSLEGSFELCEGGREDATSLIGRRVILTREMANVLAASCEGDVDCGKSDLVDLVVAITAAP